MISGLFAIGCLVIGFALIAVLHDKVGIFPFAFPHLEDVTSVIVIGLALVAFALIFRIPVKK